MATATSTRPNTDVRLVAGIGEQVYRIELIPCDREAALKSYALTKTDGTVYHVARLHDGCACDCPDFIYRRDGRDPAGCKHLKALRAFGML